MLTALSIQTFCCQKTPPPPDQTGVTFFYQKPKGEAFDVSESFSDPSWRTQRDGVPCW